MNRRGYLLLAMSVVGGALVSGCHPRGVIEIGDSRPKPVEIIASYHGSDPGFVEPMVLLVNSHEELEQLNSADLIDQGIDFDDESLLLLSLGEKPTGGYWARITAVQRQGGLLYMQGSANRPHRDQTVPQVLTYPYAAVVIKKIHSAQIRSEIDSVLGRQPVDKPLDK
jgi:hypothetical protein